MGCPMATAKSEVVSVRVEPPIKEALQKAAEREMRSMANMLEVMVVSYCRSQGHPVNGLPEIVLATPKTSGGKVD